MNRLLDRLVCTSIFSLLLLPVTALHAQTKWIQPTPEELNMTSQPEVPGATAVYLYREEMTDDKLHFFSIYKRIKVLSEGGIKFANVEVEYPAGMEGYSVDDVQGRTIHADGTIVPFTGKPYDKLIEKNKGGTTVKAKVFTMPDVQIGSIIEYSYKLHNDDMYYRSPDWYIQSDLFTRKAYYKWKPTNKQLISNDDRGQLTSAIAWTPILPVGTQIKQTRLPSSGLEDGQLILELNVDNIPPAPDEEYMPPVRSFTYRVLFYYTPYPSADEFWKNEGKHWSKMANKFIGPGPAVKAAVSQMVAPSDTEEQKLRKFYDAVMKLENTDFTRGHSITEDKSEGLKQVQNTDDILTRKRGSGDQLAALFVAMTRAAGMKSYLMAVTNRDRSLFLKSYLTLRQLDDDIAIVNVGGKDIFFDPGTRYCEYKHIAWKHDEATGLRQTDNGVAIAQTLGDGYEAAHTSRVADLTLDPHGVASGTVTMTYTGAPALRWRHRALTGDETSLNRQFRTNMEDLLPSGMEVKVQSIENLEDYDKPLKVTYSVTGPVGSATGKRLMLPADIFVANQKPSFTHEKRETAIYLDFPYFTQDATRFKFPDGFEVESAPVAEQISFQKSGFYKLSSTMTSTAVTTRRDFVTAQIIVLPTDYKDFRTFYSKFETKDQENIILKQSSSTTKPTTGGN